MAKVLYVDDEPAVCEVAKVSLTGLGGFDVMIAHSGEECLELAEMEQPDLIVLDVLLPGIDGLEAMERLRNNPDTRNIPVVLCTGTADRPESVAAYLALGAAEVLGKPIDVMGLPQVLKNVLKRAA